MTNQTNTNEFAIASAEMDIRAISGKVHLTDAKAQTARNAGIEMVNRNDIKATYGDLGIIKAQLDAYVKKIAETFGADSNNVAPATRNARSIIKTIETALSARLESLQGQRERDIQRAVAYATKDFSARQIRWEFEPRNGNGYIEVKGYDAADLNSVTYGYDYYESVSVQASFSIVDGKPVVEFTYSEGSFGGTAVATLEEAIEGAKSSTLDRMGRFWDGYDQRVRDARAALDAEGLSDLYAKAGE